MKLAHSLVLSMSHIAAAVDGSLTPVNAPCASTAADLISHLDQVQ